MTYDNTDIRLYGFLKKHQNLNNLSIINCLINPVYIDIYIYVYICFGVPNIQFKNKNLLYTVTMIG